MSYALSFRRPKETKPFLTLSLLEMLIILRVLPVTSPCEAVLGEETVAKVSLHNLVGKILRAVNVRTGGGGFDDGTPIPLADKRIVKRVDVDGHAPAMARQTPGAGDKTEIEG